MKNLPNKVTPGAIEHILAQSKTADGSVVPWQPTSAEVTNAWWYLVE